MDPKILLVDPNGALSQRFTARDDWRTSPVTREMTALYTLGYRVVPEQVADDLTGTRRTVFHHGAYCRHPQRAALLPAKKLVKMYRSGELEKADPEHPFLDCLRAMANWDALEAWRRRNVRCCLAADAYPAGLPLMARRTRLVAGEPAKAAGTPVYVGNAANAAALALVGVPVLGLREQAGRTVYELQAAGEALGGREPVKTAELLQDAREGRLAWDHPLLLAREAVTNLVAMLNTLHAAEEHTMVTWRNKTNRRQAAVLSSASAEARDMAFRHMRG